jgi:CHAT domain-containing protein
MRLKAITALFWMSFWCLPGITQKTDSSYYVYKQQLGEMFQSRGVSPAEELFRRFRDNAISSNNEFAKVLGQLFSANRGIGILLYFYNKDTLKRIFFEPGIIKEEKSIIIRKDSLLQLARDIYNSLYLYQYTVNRAPRLKTSKDAKRGADELEPIARYSFPAIISRATRILLPGSFDKRYKHLIIIPAFNIGTIPFHLLRPYNDSSFLIEHCSFTITPGLFDLVAMRLRMLNEKIKFLSSHEGFLTDPFDKVFSHRDSIRFKLRDSLSFSLDSPLFVCDPDYPTNTKYIFPKLPGTKTEIEYAKRSAKKYELLEGANATREKVIKSLGSCDVAYFATHGIADSTDPMNKSYLVLSGNKDPFLTAKDIMDLRFSTTFHAPELVILSACQTGLGKAMEAGVTGLARSFLITGSNNVIMSLWSVDDNATAYLMSRFIFYLQQKQVYTPSEPLRLAEVDTMKKFPEPAKWAGFSIFGLDY